MSFATGIFRKKSNVLALEEVSEGADKHRCAVNHSLTGQTHSCLNLSTKEFPICEDAKYCSAGYRGIIFGSNPSTGYTNCPTVDYGQNIATTTGLGYGGLVGILQLHSDGIHIEIPLKTIKDEVGSQKPPCQPLHLGGTLLYPVLEILGLTYEGGESGHVSLYVHGVTTDNLSSPALVTAGDGEVEIGLSVIGRQLNKSANLCIDGTASLTSYSNGHKTVNLITSLCTLDEESYEPPYGTGHEFHEPAVGPDDEDYTLTYCCPVESREITRDETRDTKVIVQIDNAYCLPHLTSTPCILKGRIRLKHTDGKKIEGLRCLYQALSVLVCDIEVYPEASKNRSELHKLEESPDVNGVAKDDASVPTLKGESCTGVNLNVNGGATCNDSKSLNSEDHEAKEAVEHGYGRGQSEVICISGVHICDTTKNNLCDPCTPGLDEIVLNCSQVLHEAINKQRDVGHTLDEADEYTYALGQAAEQSLEYQTEGPSEVHSSIGCYGTRSLHELPAYATDLTSNQYVKRSEVIACETLRCKLTVLTNSSALLYARCQDYNGPLYQDLGAILASSNKRPYNDYATGTHPVIDVNTSSVTVEKRHKLINKTNVTTVGKQFVVIRSISDEVCVESEKGVVVRDRVLIVKNNDEVEAASVVVGDALIQETTVVLDKSKESGAKPKAANAVDSSLSQLVKENDEVSIDEEPVDTPIVDKLASPVHYLHVYDACGSTHDCLNYDNPNAYGHEEEGLIIILHDTACANCTDCHESIVEVSCTTDVDKHVDKTDESEKPCDEVPQPVADNGHDYLDHIDRAHLGANIDKKGVAIVIVVIVGDNERQYSYGAASLSILKGLGPALSFPSTYKFRYGGVE